MENRQKTRITINTHTQELWENGRGKCKPAFGVGEKEIIPTGDFT